MKDNMEEKGMAPTKVTSFIPTHVVFNMRRNEKNPSGLHCVILSLL